MKFTKRSGVSQTLGLAFLCAVFHTGTATAQAYICKTASGVITANETGCGEGGICRAANGKWSKEECDRIAFAKKEKQEAQRQEWIARGARMAERWEPSVGMTMQEVSGHIGRQDCSDHTSIPFCYRPEINRTVLASGRHEQWVFRGLDSHSTAYLYFDNGVLTGIQTAQ